ncbi:hypothetical protein [Novosphingobium huizhouense]|uniref:hypothetical protein n=1 Tax=Novosphingobium huizhouense TaxID=2866625 RepID=UPI001CD882D0|nr:hypothetical protein [Novosphingobium huizhouense]
MNSLIAHLTPALLVRLARALSLVTLVLLMIGYADGWLTLETAALGAFGLGMLLMMAFPDQRASELLGAIAIWATTAEFMSAVQTGGFDAWRWAVTTATLAVLVLPLKVQYLRELARTAPDRTIGELDRRAWSVGAVPLGNGARAGAGEPGQAGETRSEPVRIAG